MVAALCDTHVLLPPQNRVHVLLIRLDARLAVGVDADQPAFDHRGQHEHLEKLPERAFVEPGQADRGRAAIVLGIGLVRAGVGRPENVGQGLAGKRVELVLVELRPLDGDPARGACARRRGS